MFSLKASTYKQYWRSSRAEWRWWALCRAVYKCCLSIAGAGERRFPDLHQQPYGSTSLSLLRLLAGQPAGWLWPDMKETSVVLFSLLRPSSASAIRLDLIRPVWSHIWYCWVKQTGRLAEMFKLLILSQIETANTHREYHTHTSTNFHFPSYRLNNFPHF